MSKSSRFYIRVTSEEKSELLSQAYSLGYSSVSKYIRANFLNFIQKKEISNNFKESRLNMRGIRLNEETWQKINEKSENPSDFIRQAILEKLQNNSH